MKELKKLKKNSIEVRTPHPYIRFQKARIFKMLMDKIRTSHENFIVQTLLGSIWKEL